MDNENTSSFESFELQLNDISKSFLKEAAKWANFIAIVGFVFLGLFVVLAFAMFAFGSTLSALSGGAGAMGSMGGAAIGVIYLLIALLYFFPIRYLYKFASGVKKAFAENNNEQLISAFENLKSHYKFIGILMLIGVAFYALIFIIIFIGALSSM